ncbi:Lon protease [Chloropicon primus]|uniref:endopeptidase La n=2 Tax=Chloropicon primus TaxID=1764295 RepID=A0A5B8MYA3_9CHLO|nr:Lon protease [Chloropicon primus]UPR04963.1 Lon protease [Chloropicon primus]|eukprot:QDZ25768.1 Lon protease [Chloropicon primus]
MAWVPILPLVENHGVLLPHSVATVKISLTGSKGKVAESPEAGGRARKRDKAWGKGTRESELAAVSLSLVEMVLESVGDKGSKGAHLKTQDEARRWLSERYSSQGGSTSTKKAPKGMILVAMTLVRDGDKAGGATVKATVGGNQAFEFYSVGCVCRVVQVRVDRTRREATLMIEGLARAVVKTISIVSQAFAMGHCSWPEGGQSQQGPSNEDIRNLAEALHNVQNSILSFNGIPFQGLGKLTNSLWQMGQKSEAADVPHSKAQGWVTQVSDLLLASPLLDKLMSRTQRLEALQATNAGERVRTFAAILQAKCNDHEALQLMRPANKKVGGRRGQGKELVLRRGLGSRGRDHSDAAKADQDEWDELETKLETNLPKESKVYREAIREFRRVKDASTFRNMPPQPGDNMMRKWLECVADIPWQDSEQLERQNNGSEVNNVPSHQRVLLKAISVMDERHYGLKAVKRRIIQYLAVQQLLKETRAREQEREQAEGVGGGTSLNPKVKNPVILCLVGPPGVGKTSLARTIAESLDKPLQRVSLGGVRDEAEIRGHRRTYIGAMPGRVVQALIQSKSNKPVLLLDEMDKAGNPDGGVSVRGDPLGALLEVLDPEQNHSFVDHYVGHAIDLSEVFFIATANSLETMPPALRDRLEIVRLQAYSSSEKAAIGTTHLWPKQLMKHGLSGALVDTGKGKDALNVTISKLQPSMVEYIAENYTREAGVRQLERCLASICRHIATKVALDLEKRAKAKDFVKDPPSSPLRFEVDDELVEVVLGAPKVGNYRVLYKNLCRRLQTPGVAAGLAWTSSGMGTVQLVECCSIKSVSSLALKQSGNVGGDLTNALGRMTLTGQLGEVLEESAQIALTWARSMCSQATLSSRGQRGGQGLSDHEKSLCLYESAMLSDIHVHLPAGSVPKDGPSAGVTIAVALTSLFFGAKCRADTAMTGEISLHGTVLPVGGVAEKVRAAQKIGMSRVVVPESNEEEAREALKDSKQLKEVEVIPVKTVEEAIDAAIVGGNPWHSASVWGQGPVLSQEVAAKL